MPCRKALSERIRGNEKLRRQQEQWERDRRREDREDRRLKDEELNGVRLQLRDQAATFATRDQIHTLERTIEQRIEAALERLNVEGTESFREREARRTGSEQATADISKALELNRRWIIGLAATVILSVGGLIYDIVSSR